MIPGVVPSVNPTPGARIRFLGQINNTTTTASVSMGNVTALEAGLLVVAHVGRCTASRTVSNVSIGGTTGTLHVASAASTDPHSLASRVVSSGANNITVVYNTTSGTSANTYVGAWLITNYNSTAPTGSDAQTLLAATVISTTFASSHGGVGVWATRVLSTTGNTFSSATIDDNTTVAALRFTAASNRFLPASAGYVESISNSTSASRIGVGGSWR